LHHDPNNKRHATIFCVAGRQHLSASLRISPRRADIRRLAKLTTLDGEAVVRAVKRLVKLKLIYFQKAIGKVTHY